MEFERVVAVRNNKTIYRSGDKLIKVFDNHYSKAGVLNEALNQARIEETGLNIPSLLEVLKIDGKWSIVMDFIKGKTLERLISENPEKTDEYLKIFVETQLSIHSKKSKLLTILNDKMIRKIESTDLSKTIKYDLYTRLSGFEQHDKVLHGDYQLSNVIMGEDGKVYIVDWSHSTQGNASADVAMSYLLMLMNQNADLAEKYLHLFEELSGTDSHYIKKWIPIVAASHLKDCNKQHIDMLNSFVDVVDY